MLTQASRHVNDWCVPLDEEARVDSNTQTAQKKHELIRRHLENEISGGLEPHQRLPGERELAELLGVNRLTVRRALDEMERDGLIYRVQGAGTFVRPHQITKSFEFSSFSEDMRVRNMVPGSLSLETSLESAGMRIGYALGLSPATPVVHIRRVRTADGTPLCLEDSYLPAALVAGLETGIEGDSLYADLSRRFDLRPERADQTIQATVLDEESAARLLVPAFSPAFRVERTAFDSRDRAVEYAESLYRGDRYSYNLSITRAPQQRKP
jgi:GntR family transcriptional regulator